MGQRRVLGPARNISRKNIFIIYNFGAPDYQIKTENPPIFTDVYNSIAYLQIFQTPLTHA